MFALLGVMDVVLRELLLFAGAGVLLGGIDDLAVDIVWCARTGWHRLRGSGGMVPLLDDLPPIDPASRFAVFIPAWDESGVIAPMLRLTAARLDHPGCTFFVGCYPNDRATIAAVMRVARDEPRIRPVIGVRDGPTTKADCLNTLWRALMREDAGRDGADATRAVILHDAEDVVPAGELRVFDALIGGHDIVQLPVLPLIDPDRPLVSGVVADEFAENHSKTLVVRAMVGAGLPLAGVGCAIATPVLHALAARHGTPFDADSLCEDYEIGLRATALGARACFARVAAAAGEPVMAVREYFPATLGAAVRQKARWMTGIALAGWDRTGWARPLAIGDHWMRARDRRAPLAMLVLCSCYLALLTWGVTALAHAVAGVAVARMSGGMTLLLQVNAALLVWRMAMRALFTHRAYGRREALRSVPRMLVGNLIALLAARRALWCYLKLLGGGAACWDKTTHAFPAEFGGNGPPMVAGPA
ncbi:glycosyl transferase family protein [Sphingomonas bacterium]|uniref:glycosyl transferase family protein n=1 Tax=Sphingomonas bacterium TaxID=1895847 RepID=UPI0020C720B5|nr:glycosyl transferase family protein [Sphingomonas bacterium]